MMLPEPCGCQNVESVFGLILSVSKCENHRQSQRKPASIGQDYFAELGINENNFDSLPHVAEMIEALGEFPDGHGKRVLEIGCGLSPYVAHLIGLGYEYIAIEPCRFAADIVRRKFNVQVFESAWPDVPDIDAVDLIVCAHSLEHMADPILSLAQMRQLLRPNGTLQILVPEGTDRVNPDHLVFFTAESLASCVGSVGMTVMNCVVIRHIEHERFIYLIARL